MTDVEHHKTIDTTLQKSFHCVVLQTESQQRIIYSGKLLLDNHQLQDVLKQVGAAAILPICCLVSGLSLFLMHLTEERSFEWTLNLSLGYFMKSHSLECYPETTEQAVVSLFSSDSDERLAFIIVWV